MINLINTECPLISYKVLNHKELKPKLLEAIKTMGIHSLIEPHNGEHISNTDWHLNSNLDRPYYSLIEPLIQQTCKNIKDVFNIEQNLTPQNYWFQEYHTNDYHNWHIHERSMFSNVYYLSLPNDSSYTTFKIKNKEFEIPIEEGMLLTFPSFYVHTSKKNKSLEPKISIVFNI